MMLLIFVIVLYTQFVTGKDQETCYKWDCDAVSDYFLDGLDTSVNPCDNFYKFTCNRLISKDLAVNELLWNEFLDINRQLNDKLGTIFYETSDTILSNSSAAKLVYRLFSDCIHNFGKVSMVYDFINNLLGEYDPKGHVSKPDWTKISYILRSNGINPKIYLPISVEYDFFDKSKYTLVIDLPDVVAPKHILLKGIGDPHVQTYKRNVIQIAKSMNRMADTDEEVTNIVELEIKLAHIASPLFKHEKKTLKELQKKYPSICWQTYVTKMLAIPHVIFGDDDVVMVRSSDHLDNIFEILQNTSQSTLVSYVAYRATATLLDAIGLNINRWLSTSPTKTCIDLTKRTLPIPMAALFVKKFISSGIKQNLTELVHDLKESLIEILENSVWLNDISKAMAIRKIRLMSQHIAYPEELLDDSKLDNYYEPVRRNESYLQFYLNILKWTDDEAFGKLTKVPHKNDWKSQVSLLDVNAYYHPLENNIQILAGILTSPVYNQNLPNYVNYAGIGAIVGHEIYHGVSGAGLDFDEYGQINPWVTSEEVAKLDEMAKCLRERYAEISRDERKAWLTNDEDQADVVGVMVAYKAYQNWVKRHGKEYHPSPVNEFTQNQLFWISYGRLWCARESDYYLTHFLPFTKHSRYMYRVLVPLMNSEEFSKDFNCPLGSYMNPTDKCKF